METPYIDQNIAPGLEKSSADDKESNYGNYRAHDGGHCYSKTYPEDWTRPPRRRLRIQFSARIESGDRRLVIDLSQLDYISSAGLRVFALAGKRLNSTNGKLVLCGFKKTIPYNTLNRIPDPVREVFDTSGFSLIFPSYGSHDDAIEALQA